MTHPAKINTDPEPLPDRAPGRALAIAAIHAYAEYLAEHPEIPAPEHLVAWTHEFFSEPEAYHASVGTYRALFGTGARPGTFQVLDERINGVHVEQYVGLYAPESRRGEAWQ